MGDRKHHQLLPFLIPLLCNTPVYAASTGDFPSVTVPALPAHDGKSLFKGKPIPTIDWMSPDTVNFTWGLTGVDNFKNLMFSTYLFATLGSVVALLFVFRTFIYHINNQRLAITVASSYTTTASHFYSLPPARWFSLLRRYLILAPLHKLRHNNPFIVNFPAPSVKIHLGTLPSRLNFIVIFLYLLSNFLYCTLYLPWDGSIGPDGKLREPTKAALVAEFRGRTGVMAVVNMIPLFVCMARNNFVGHAVEVGFDIWNLFHRWIGRVVVLESVAHMLAWTVNKVDQAGWKGLDKALRISPFYQVGLMAEIALILIAILSASPLRHANYEFFLSMHQLLVVFFVAGVWWHLHIDILPQMVYCNIAIAIWVADRVFRILRILRNNIRWRRKGLSCNIAEVTPLKGGDAVRFSVELYTSFGYKPGTHAYLYVPRIGWWQSHPFSIAWSSTEESTQMIEVTQIPDRWETRNSTLTIATVDAISRSQNRATTSVDHNAPKNPYDPSIYHSGINSVQVSVAAVSPGGTSMQQKMYNNLENYLRDNNPHGSLPTNPRNTIVRNSSVLPMRHRELVATSTPKKTTMHFIISKHNGFTKALYDAAQSATATTDPEKPENGCVLKVLGLVEGPYGGHHSFDSFGTVVLVAGGVGITHCLGYVRHLLHGYSEGTAATQKLKLVWVIRKSEYIDWVSDWLEEILRMPFCRQVLKIDIYITRPSDTTSGNGWAGRGGIVSVHVGRPEFETVIEKVVRHRVGAMAVTVCGGGAVSDSVRAATLKFIEQATIDFSEESFTW